MDNWPNYKSLRRNHRAAIREIVSDTWQRLHLDQPMTPGVRKNSKSMFKRCVKDELRKLKNIVTVKGVLDKNAVNDEIQRAKDILSTWKVNEEWPVDFAKLFEEDENNNAVTDEGSPAPTEAEETPDTASTGQDAEAR